MANQEGGGRTQPVNHRAVHSGLSEYHHSYGLYSSSSSSLVSSSHDLSISTSSSKAHLSSSASSIASSIISGKWLKSRFHLTAECLRAERVCWVKFGSAVLNFTNSILGAGLMGIPYAMSRAGLVPGVIILVLIAFISDWSVRIMVKSGKAANATSYQDLMFKVYGRLGSSLCALFQVIFAFGCMCAYQLIIADNIRRAVGNYLPDSLLRNRSIVILAGNLLVVLPLSLARDVTFIGKVASLSVGGNILILMAVLLQRGQSTAMAASEGLKWIGPGFIEAIGVISFSFVCHHNTFVIRESLESKSSRLFSVVTSLSVGFSLLVSLTLSIPAYLHFGSSTDANILNNFDDSNGLINLCRLVLAVSLYVSFPLDCFVARDVIARSLFPRTNLKMPDIVHTAITFIIVGLTTAVALLFKDLGEVLELTGGVSASALAFIFPAAAFLKISRGRKNRKLERIGAVLLMIFGAFVLGLTLIEACRGFYNRKTL